jgi:twitching motility protein PilT
LPEDAAHRFATRGTVDAARRDGPGAPYRLHLYRSTSGTRAAFRLHSAAVPALEHLALPAIVATFVERPNGLLLFTGPTGSGKTTALAALVDRINRTAERVVVTCEDPVEYLHAPRRSLIAHCEVGRDVPDYGEALRGFLRADPDVILIGEMRDRETIEAALTAAETGHLVLSTLHTNDAPQTIDRIVDTFHSSAHPQVRSQLAATLIAVASLRLVPRRDAAGRAAACEILVATDAVRAMIREGKTHQLRNALATGRSVGMQPLETHLSDLVVRGRITLEAARTVANRPADIREVERTG